MFALKIAYAIQNVGGIDLATDVGDTVPVKNSLRRVQEFGHQVTVFKLDGRVVAEIPNLNSPGDQRSLDTGVVNTRPVLFLESAIRRAQVELGLPYFALFDSARFYFTCLDRFAEYDICHEHNGLFSIGTALACLRLRKPYVLTFSADPILELELIGTPLRGLHLRAARWMASFTFRLADAIICVSNQSRDHLIESWEVDPDKIHVLPNGVDTELFRPVSDNAKLRSELKMSGSGPVVGFVGGFHAWHGLDVLVRAFEKVKLKVPSAKLLLVGDGPVRETVEHLVDSLGLQEATVMTGHIDQLEVPEFLGVMDVVTLPYPPLPKAMWFSPLKLYEYLASGKAIVASDAGQISEVLRHGETGILVEPGNPDALAEAITDLLRSAGQRARVGRAARQQAVEEHSWDRYATRLEKVYRGVIDSSNQAKLRRTANRVE